jgi:HAD superfamily hydrolase (TIGR01484 family)
MERLSIGIVDINGTIHTNQEGVSKSVVESFKYLWTKGITTTIVTGRGFRRSRELLGESGDKIITRIMPISVENGGRLITQEGKNIKYYPLTPSEIKSILDVVQTQTDKIDFIGYYPQNPNDKAVVWSQNCDPTNEFSKRHGNFFEITKLTLPELTQRIEQDKPCMLIVKLNTPKIKDLFYGTNMVVNETELNFLSAGINKGTGVKDISELMDVPLSRVFVAGNDHNDYPMMRLDVGKKFFVGDNTEGLKNIADIVNLCTPNDLGNYLFQME